MSEPIGVLARALREQAGWCGRLGSPLYETLLVRIAEDVECSGICREVLEPHAADPPRMKLPLRLLSAVHRLVLTGELPGLAHYYPSAGGTGDGEGAWTAFRDAVEQHRDRLRTSLPATVQTAEVKRCCALLPGFLEVSRRTRLPLRLLEVGSCAGLNLRWDCYRYETRQGAWGPPDAPLVFRDAYASEPPRFDAEARVSERCGCDLNPLDPTSDEGRLALQSFLWPDQLDRFERLAGAIEVARRVPASLDRSDAVSWLERQLAAPRKGVATVVFHSIVLLYFTPEARARFIQILQQAGERATEDAPVAWLSMEPAEDKNATDAIHLRLWPGGKRRQIAEAGFHAGPVSILRH